MHGMAVAAARTTSGASSVGIVDGVAAAHWGERTDRPRTARRAAIDVARDERAIWSNAARAVDPYNARWWRHAREHERDRVHDLSPRSDVEDAVVVGVEILQVHAGKAAHQHVGHVVLVFEVDAVGTRHDEAGNAQRHGGLSGNEEAVGANDLTRKRNDCLDCARRRSRAVVTDHDVGEVTDAGAGRALEFEVLVVVCSRHIDAGFVDDHARGDAREVDRAWSIDADKRILRTEVPLRSVGAQPRCCGLKSAIRTDGGGRVVPIALETVGRIVGNDREARDDG